MHKNAFFIVLRTVSKMCMFRHAVWKQSRCRSTAEPPPYKLPCQAPLDVCWTQRLIQRKTLVAERGCSPGKQHTDGQVGCDVDCKKDHLAFAQVLPASAPDSFSGIAGCGHAQQSRHPPARRGDHFDSTCSTRPYDFHVRGQAHSLAALYAAVHLVTSPDGLISFLELCEAVNATCQKDQWSRFW